MQSVQNLGGDNRLVKEQIGFSPGSLAASVMLFGNM